MRNIVAALLLAAILTGCSPTELPAETPSIPTEVYSDDKVTILVNGVVEAQGRKYVALTVENLTDSAIVLCGTLGLTVSDTDGSSLTESDPAAAYTVALEKIEGYLPIDGVIEPGGSRSGYIFFCSGGGGEIISLATDYADNVWAQFVCPQ